jgi:hypothetical protein
LKLHTAVPALHSGIYHAKHSGVPKPLNLFKDQWAQLQNGNLLVFAFDTNCSGTNTFTNRIFTVDFLLSFDWQRRLNSQGPRYSFVCASWLRQLSTRSSQIES